MLKKIKRCLYNNNIYQHRSRAAGFPKPSQPAAEIPAEQRNSVGKEEQPQGLISAPPHGVKMDFFLSLFFFNYYSFSSHPVGETSHLEEKSRLQLLIKSSKPFPASSCTRSNL